MRRPSLHLTGLAAAGLLVLGACGGGSADPGAGAGAGAAVTVTTAPATSATTAARATTATAGPADTSAPTTGASPSSGAPAAPSPLPDVTVLDAGTGADVALAGLLPADRPLLIWFWAPH